jgi:carbonic anhydrase
MTAHTDPAATDTTPVSGLEQLLDRNKAFARTDAKDKVPAIPFVPNKQTFILTCIDPRVDPTNILGLDLGDAIVCRNVGGRVTAAVIQDVAWISYLHEVKTPDAPWFELAIIHHNDCGSGLYADAELRHGFAARGFDESALIELPVLDPAETVRLDVQRLSTAPQVSANITISGYAYDLHTGLLTTVVAGGAAGVGSSVASAPREVSASPPRGEVIARCGH